MGHFWYALILSGHNQLKKASDHMDIARQLDPLSPVILSGTGLIALFGNSPDKAILYLKEALEIDPNFTRAHFWIALAYAVKMNYKQALYHHQ